MGEGAGPAGGSAPPVRDAAQQQWPRFRGPEGTGVAHYASAPTHWDVPKGRGLRWKAPVPLPGRGSPVVWGERVFVSGADGRRFRIYAFDARTGTLLWQAEAPQCTAPADDSEVPQMTGYAAPTPATDGNRVVALFADGTVLCTDVAGKPLWTRRLGMPRNKYAHGSSPIIVDGKVIIQLDQGEAEEGRSALVALSVQAGDPVWRTPRPVPASWATPIAIQAAGKTQIITAAAPWVASYAADSGLELWRAACLGGDVAPSPTFADGLVFAANVNSRIAAVRPEGTGDVTSTHVVWTAEQSLPDTCSPVAGGGLVFTLASEGILTCYDAATGQPVWEKALGMRFLSSPSLVGDRLYLQGEDGVMVVLRAGRRYEPIARCPLGEPSSCSAAFMDGCVYIRGDKHLFCLQADSGAEGAPNGRPRAVPGGVGSPGVGGKVRQSGR